jgi:hypothetical protein
VIQTLPAARFEAYDLQSGQVTSTSMVRYRGNDYSVPVAYGHRDVWIKGFVGRVTIGCAVEVIAHHPRSYETDDMVINPLHYLPLIERKIMAFDQAAPLQGWELPDAFTTIQRLLEARQGKTGTFGIRRAYLVDIHTFLLYTLSVLQTGLSYIDRSEAIMGHMRKKYSV